MIFTPKTTDYTLSPYTGLTRESWLEAARYLLEGMFRNLKSEAEPLVMPRAETEITYPHKNTTGKYKTLEERAEYFEALTRSFFIAAPVIKDNPNTFISGYSIRDYYKNQVLRAATKGDRNSVFSYDELVAEFGKNEPFRCYQQTVETCALVICLWDCKDEIWDKYDKTEKDIIANFLTGYAHGNTVPQNWRFFNMLVLAFLHNCGYEIDKDIMRDHAQSVLSYYAGDGWYRDGHSFDYYSCWAFNVYAPIWNTWYGYEHEAFIAARFEENSNKLLETYPDFFDRNGFTNMWGRSSIYRNAATSPFGAHFFLREAKGDPGLARRITSGSLLQFLSREDFLTNGTPSIGFYGQFAPLVQGYSCAESPFWLGKAFLCLHLPAEHPFWCTPENNGTWDKLNETEVKITTLDGPALCFSNHGANGETVLRTGKVVKNKGDIHGMWNYSKLCYNTKFPWEAAPSENVEAQQYVMQNLTYGHYEKANVTFWHGSRDDVLYRRQFFNYELITECHWMNAVNLADFTVPLGIIRADKIRLFQRPTSITLGSYGFPDNGTEIIHRDNGIAKAIILKGRDFTGEKTQMAMTIFDGWDGLNTIHSKGTNPDSENSIIIYATATKQKQYGYEPYIMISQVITKSSHDDFTDDELFPIKAVTYTDKENCGGYGSVHIKLKNGSIKRISYDEMENKLEL